MNRRMSCSLTVDAVRTRTKTVTRRHVDTWRNLKPGDQLTLVKKARGLPKGATHVVLAEVEIIDVRVEDLAEVDSDECAAEGFPDMRPEEFVDFWLASHGYRTDNPHRCYVQCRRIEWRYLEDET